MHVKNPILFGLMAILLLGGTITPGFSQSAFNPNSIIINEVEINHPNGNEFVELYNPHPFGINLSLWRLADAVNALVPANTWLNAGEYIVFANDTASFYQLIPPFTVIIPFSGSSGLHNSGETIRLLRSDGSESDQVSYSDYGEWPTEPDGGGPSLEWRGINFDNVLPSSWMPSNAMGGSPGSANSTWAD